MDALFARTVINVSSASLITTIPLMISAGNVQTNTNTVCDAQSSRTAPNARTLLILFKASAYLAVVSAKDATNAVAKITALNVYQTHFICKTRVVWFAALAYHIARLAETRHFV